MLASYADAVAMPVEIITANSAKTDNILDSLRNYGIKIFLQPESNKVLRGSSDSGLARNEVRNSSKIAGGFDGIYLDSTDVTPAAKGNNIPVTASTATQESQIENSTLPPFFSNLGLSQPKNTGNSFDREPDQDSISEELE
jgi:hypothetical protein